ncbi:unnamed protein product [Ranitomeya imitator]|uniref:Uncharacterized protein n=1 Tax=Ranitomeya imitator TaxID=111125 RepID=A0ABN9MMK9_9NEOB|nr:unnamed protein product [Ranitomeya imitator]
MEMMELLDETELWERGVIVEIQDLRVLLVLKVLQELQDQLVHQGKLGQEVNQVPVDQWAHQEELGNVACRDHKDLKVIKEIMVNVEKEGKRGIEVSLVYKVFQVLL